MIDWSSSEFGEIDMGLSICGGLEIECTQARTIWPVNAGTAEGNHVTAIAMSSWTRNSLSNGTASMASKCTVHRDRTRGVVNDPG